MRNLIVVTGAGGTVGRHLVSALRGHGAALREAYHAPAAVQRARSEGHESCAIDFDRPETLLAAFGGAAALFLLAPNGPRQLEQERAAVTAARRAGITSIVKLSAWRAPEREFSFARIHREIECAIEASGLAWTFLRPCGFMQNFSTSMAGPIRLRSAFALPAGDARVSHVDVRDVAAVAARVLTAPGHAGKAYDLSGPHALTYAEVAGILSEALGRPISYVSQSEDEARAGMLAAGLTPGYAEEVIDLFRAYRAGGGQAVTGDVAALLGRAPTSFEHFVRDHVEQFR